MPPKYFAFIDGEQKGPFTLDQLTEVGVHPSTYVWCKEMADWQRADQVEEIRNLFRHHIEVRKEAAQEVQPVAPADMRPDSKPEENSPRSARFSLPPVEEQVDLSRPPQVSMTLAVLSMLLCFFPTGIAAVVFTYKAQKCWETAVWEERKESMKKDSGAIEDLRRRAHEYERLSKMWMGLTVAFGIIAWTLLFSIPRQ